MLGSSLWIPALPTPIILCESQVYTVVSFCFMGTIMAQGLKWVLNINSLIKKVHQQIYFYNIFKVGGTCQSNTWMAGPQDSQQNIAQSMTLPLLACLFSIVHPGSMCSP
ncbi:hypothetical protein QTP86_021445, partial [Hemibagrus guttatus]